jgi:hypothetical protein
LFCGVCDVAVCDVCLYFVGFVRSVCLPIWFSFCEAVSMVLSASPEFFIQSKVLIIFPSCSIPCAWARSLAMISGMRLGSESLDRIRTLACGAGDLGFKSQRARQQI